MTSKLKLAIAVAASLVVSACVTVADAPSGQYKVGDAYQVTLGQHWSDVSGLMARETPHVRVLTIDGPLLDRLYLTDGLAVGDYLLKPAAKERPTPTFHAGMSPTERVEFIADSVSALDYKKIETSNLRPAKLNDTDAVRFDLTGATKEGLDISGTAVVAEKGGRLLVVLYLAPTEHYFAANLGEIEAIIKSARGAG